MKSASIVTFLFLLVTGSLAVFPFSECPAAVITPDTLTPDINPDGQCSLMEAVENANNDAATHADCPAGSGADTIELAPRGAYTLTNAGYVSPGGNSTGLWITSNLTINGNNAILERSTAEGTPEFRVLGVSAKGTARINDLTVRNGAATTGDLKVQFGGGIESAGALEMRNVTVTNCLAGTGGGGIMVVDGTAVLTDCRITNCEARQGGGINVQDSDVTLNQTIVSGNTATSGSGGGIVKASDEGTSRLTLNECQVLNNVATGSAIPSGDGGGLSNGFAGEASNASSLVILNDSTVSGNEAFNGGGISNGNLIPKPGCTASMTINRSTISGNRANGSGERIGNGGGIFNINAEMTLANSTVSGNQANGTGNLSGLGGGIGNAAAGLYTVVNLINTTVSNNTAVAAGGGLATATLTADNPAEAAGGGSTLADEAPIGWLSFKNSLVAGNTAYMGNGCIYQSGGIVSSGNNLEDGDTCAFTLSTDMINTDPLLGPLQDNGGPTQTHALLEGSPAIDAADNAVCAASPINGIDQRGTARPQGNGCDIGAYEAVSEAPPVIPTTTEWGMILFMTLMSIVSVYYMRKRQMF